MPIPHFNTSTDTGATLVSIINQTVDKANLVDGKAAQTALEAEANARQVAVATEAAARQAAVSADATARANGDNANAADTNVAAVSDLSRPGERPALWAANIAGSPASLAPLTGSVTRQDGAAIAVTGAGLRAPRAITRVEPGHLYRVRYVVRRTTNAPDPAGDGVTLGVLWMGAAKAIISTTNLDVITNLTVGSGRVERTFNFSAAAGAEVDAVAPGGTVYARPYVQTFGTTGVTDIEVLEVVDVTEWGVFNGGDLTAVEGRLTALESVGTGVRLDAIETALDGTKIQRFATYSDALGAELLPTTEAVETLGYAAAGNRGGGLYVKVDSEPSHDGKLLIDTTWFELRTERPTLEMFGGGVGEADNAAAVISAAGYCAAMGLRTVYVDGAIAVTSNVPQGDVADITFVGTGSISGIYRKQVIPPNSPPAVLQSIGMVPDRHLQKLNLRQNPRVVFVGDSISTYYANTIGRSDNIAEIVEREIVRQIGPISFVNRSVNGGTYAAVGTLAPDIFSIPWATVPGQMWIDYIEALAPDLIVLSLGQNDRDEISYNWMKYIIDQTATWAKVPGFVFCTNVPSSYGSKGNPTFATRTAQEQRDIAAGFTRTFAQFYGYGLLDMHRLCCMVRDGFDPCSSVLSEGDTVDATIVEGNLTAVGTREVYDFRVGINFDASEWTDEGGTLTIKTGTGPCADFVTITRSSSSAFRVFGYGGTLEDNVQYMNEIITFAPPSSAMSRLVLEKHGNRFTIYDDSTDNGTYARPVFAGQLISRGGMFFPTVVSTGNCPLISADFSYGEPRTNMPSATDSQLWGDGTTPPGYHGGTGYNHPSDYMAALVYRPVVEGACWSTPARPTFRAHRNDVDQSVATSSAVTVQFTAAALDNASAFSGGSNGFAVPADGTYYVRASITLTACPADARVFAVIAKTGVNQFAEAGYAKGSTGATDLQTFTVSGELALAKGDVITALVQISGSGTKTIFGSPFWTHLDVHRLS
ncbi:SGNH/GDSL hydrolase family protein [Aquabacter sp. CN5-332]|uniref:SGNH/GDSL hydrolase family protein n=1 Tax=Aquabacter sp. CN5-332 TaxID=3156608 RepID=UPI0032B3FD54